MLTDIEMGQRRIRKGLYRPNHKWRKEPYSDGVNRSCWDCEKLWVGPGFNRECGKHPSRYMFSGGHIAVQVREFGVESVYNDCSDFELIEEFKKQGCIFVWGEQDVE